MACREVSVSRPITVPLRRRGAAIQARTTVDKTARTVVLNQVELALRFPGMAEAEAAALRAQTTACLPNLNGMTVSLDQVLAYLSRQVKTPRTRSKAPCTVHHVGTLNLEP